MPASLKINPPERNPSRISTKDRSTDSQPYVLDQQVGFILRQVMQRHVSIFSERIGNQLTPRQFAALAKLYECGPLSQNRLGRYTAMDVATIKGVVDRLTHRGFTKVQPHAADARLLLVQLTSKGRAAVESAIPRAFDISQETLSPLTKKERATFLRLLRRLS
ncbi:MAG: winged helix-turn-helix transcriptional regulator [Acidobacteria bacterium]|nr:winged helix-turn-helix transcriptional regulator [Acidobacteriota bacterium]